MSYGNTIRVSPDKRLLTTSLSEEPALKERSSPSGSAKWSERTATIVSLGPIWASGNESETVGARFGTVTVKLSSAERPPGSVAVTVTVAVPWPTPATVRVAPDAEAVATLSSEEAAA